MLSSLLSRRVRTHGFLSFVKRLSKAGEANTGIIVMGIFMVCNTICVMLITTVVDDYLHSLQQR